jgi:putative phosphoribosyl transferase
MIFHSREEAGHRLAEALKQYRNHPDGVILALPRGGVAVGYAMSRDLHLPLDVFITRKIGVPDNPEYALGAVSETGNIYVNLEAASLYGLSYHQIEEFARVERGGNSPPSAALSKEAVCSTVKRSNHPLGG